MSAPSHLPAPEFREWSVAAVHLLQGVVYAEDARDWDIVLRWRSQLEPFLARIGLVLVIDEADGFAYVRQWTEDECPAGYEQIPKFMRRAALGYGPTLLAVLLRDALRQFEENDFHNERCVVESDAIMDQWKAFFAPTNDEIRQRRDFLAALHKLEEVGFVRHFSDSPPAWEIRKVLKARLPVAELEILRSRLMDASSKRGARTVVEGGDE